MKKRILLAVTGLLMLTSVVSCKKYEDGPLISLTPRAERMTNTWVFAYAEEDGENVSSEYDQYELYMNLDGEAQLDASYTSFGVTYSTSTSGKWRFTNDEENVLFDFDDDEFDNEYNILRLMNEELWLKDLDKDLELHLLPK